MKTLKKILYTFGLIFIFNLTGCTEVLDEIKDIAYDRAFSPLEVKAIIRNKVNAELTWKVTKADSYVIEVFKNDSLTFAGSPVLTIADIKSTDLPYTIVGLDGATKYSARIKAILADAGDSKWSGVFFKTQDENIFLPFMNEDIKAKSVVLRWTPSPKVSALKITSEGLPEIVHNLSAAEIAAGVAEVSGLNGETKYSAVIYNGEVQRGKTSFTTLVDLGNAMPVNPTDDFAAILAAAKAGDAFALYPGTYGSATKFIVPANVEIKAVYPNDKPVIMGYFSIENNTSLLLKDLVMDGAGLPDGNQSIIFATVGATYGNLQVEACEIKNYVKGLIYLNVAATVESIVINNSIIHDVECSGGDFLDNRLGAYKVLTLSNSTIYNSVKARDFIRYDNTSAAYPSILPVFNIENNTLNGVANDVTRRLLYIRVPGTINFRSNIVSNTLAHFSNQSTTPIPSFNKNNYFGAPGLLTGGSTVSKIFDDSASILNPGYAAPATGNFKVSNQTIIDNEIGDPRWLK